MNKTLSPEFEPLTWLRRLDAMIYFAKIGQFSNEL